jgi:hypothetical protein
MAASGVAGPMRALARHPLLIPLLAALLLGALHQSASARALAPGGHGPAGELGAHSAPAGLPAPATPLAMADLGVPGGEDEGWRGEAPSIARTMAPASERPAPLARWHVAPPLRHLLCVYRL